MRSSFFMRGMFVAAVVLISVCSVSAEPFSFADFTSGENLNFQGDVSLSSGVLRLTAADLYLAGSAWYATQQAVDAGFTTTFTFQITDQGGVTDSDGVTGADGFAFVIQNTTATAVGTEGGWLGYTGIENSVAIEFDTYNNVTDSFDPSGNHISVQTCGVSANSANHTYSLGATSDIPDMSDGNVHTASLTYANKVLHVYLDAVHALDVSVDLASTLELNEGKAWVGFTAATGSAYETHDILNWTMVTVPEPSSIVLLGIGGVGLIGYAWRKLKQAA